MLISELVVPAIISSIVIDGDEIAPRHPYLHIQREYGDEYRENTYCQLLGYLSDGRCKIIGQAVYACWRDLP
jgi:hypothetical protein